MKIKRITCLILAALLIIATLGACKDKKGNDGSTQDGSHVSADVFFFTGFRMQTSSLNFGVSMYRLCKNAARNVQS